MSWLCYSAKRVISWHCKRQVEVGETCVYPPELFNRIECDDLLEQIIPIVLPLEKTKLIPGPKNPLKFHASKTQYGADLIARRLSIPKSPLIHEGVFDIKVISRVKDGKLLLIARKSKAVLSGLLLNLAIRRGNGNLIKRTLLVGNHNS